MTLALDLTKRNVLLWQHNNSEYVKTNNVIHYELTNSTKKARKHQTVCSVTQKNARRVPPHLKNKIKYQQLEECIQKQLVLTADASACQAWEG